MIYQKNLYIVSQESFHPPSVTVGRNHAMFKMFDGIYFFQVAGLFRDATIGNAINIVVVRLILLEQDEVKTSSK